MELIILLAICVVPLLLFGVLGRALAATKGNGDAGFWLGFFLGPIGIVIALLLPPKGDAAALTEIKRQRMTPYERAKLRSQPEVTEEHCDPEPVEETISFSCPSCRLSNTVSIELIGTKVMCIECGEVVKVPKVVKCRDCDQTVSIRVKACPHCGSPTR